MEKLLRSCDIDTIYIMIRTKKGKSMDSRFKELFNDIVFDRLKKEDPNFEHKVVAISGDCSLPGLEMK